MLGGYRESLAMEIVQNADFHEADDFGDLLARHRELWTSYESRLSRYPPRAPLRPRAKAAHRLAFVHRAHSRGSRSERRHRSWTRATEPDAPAKGRV